MFTLLAQVDPTCNSGNGINTALGCLPTDPQAFIETSFPWFLSLAGITAFLLIVYGAFLHITAAGNPENVQKAKEVIFSAISGLVIVIFSALLLQTIGADVLKLPGF